jgi:hypothetical protein
MAFFNPDDILNKFGLPNYIQNGNFEMYNTFAAQVAGATKWNAYKDAAQATPVDGTGGTATVIRNASVGSGSQLRGTRSWQITKTGNAQGEGYSQDFTIDAADKSRNVGISFDYSAGSAYTTGDMAVYVYDITNATLITPTSVNIPSGSGTFSTTFLATTSTSYRLIFHCAASNATTTNWSMTVDTVQVSRNEATASPVYSEGGKIVSSAGTNWSGTVSQNGTSSVIERGSNANGEYIKFADGTMICTSSSINAPNQITVAFGSIFRTNDFDWTFPSSFLDGGSWNASGIERSNVGGCWVARSTGGGETASKASFVVYRPASSAGIPQCRFIAIGRWY